MAGHPPAIQSGKRLKILFGTQPDRPSGKVIPIPEFVLFVNDEKLLDQSYRRYLDTQLREKAPFTGLPILFHLRARTPRDKANEPGARNSGGIPRRADAPPAVHASTPTRRRTSPSGAWAARQFPEGRAISRNFVLQSNTLPRKVARMQTATEAEEHLRVIRSLMEKATIYRAVSAPTALAGGMAAVIVASSPVQRLFDQFNPITSFHVRWLLALFGTLLVNGLLILREARRRGDPLISPGMRTAFQSLLPPMLCGGVFFSVFGPREGAGFSHHFLRPRFTGDGPFRAAFHRVAGLGFSAYRADDLRFDHGRSLELCGAAGRHHGRDFWRLPLHLRRLHLAAPGPGGSLERHAVNRCSTSINSTRSSMKRAASES
ncbi:MAG: hypothetical protein WDN28_13930 [Chthoniobacter sp.]